jgi:hypothetical protein
MVVPGTLAWPRGSGPSSLPPGLQCYSLEMPGAPIETLPDGVRAMFRLNLQGCDRLRTLPRGLAAGTIDVSGCTSLETLPEEFDARFLIISGCRRLSGWPSRATLRVGGLVARDCPLLTELPPWLGRLSYLDLAGCSRLESLPEGMEVSSWIDVGDTQIRELPQSLKGVGLRWRGVPVDERICFRPEEITGREILAERNAEVRRVMMERMGFDAFLEEVDSETLDVDRDPGGERRLLRVELEDDEPLVCVAVFCPSTKRRYVLRVPPETTTCRQAIAWTAGFDDPELYQPLVET